MLFVRGLKGIEFFFFLLRGEVFLEGVGMCYMEMIERREKVGEREYLY